MGFAFFRVSSQNKRSPIRINIKVLGEENYTGQLTTLVSKYVPKPNQMSSDYLFTSLKFRIDCDYNLEKVFKNSLFHFTFYSLEDVNLMVLVTFGRDCVTLS